VVLPGCPADVLHNLLGQRITAQGGRRATPRAVRAARRGWFRGGWTLSDPKLCGRERTTFLLRSAISHFLGKKIRGAMNNTIVIPVKNLPGDVNILRDEATSEGFRFMDKLCDEWQSGANRFSGSGEVFLGVFQGPRLIGLGGLNVDPYVTGSETGRLRHVYVLKSHRRQGVATKLVRKLLDEARYSFRSVRLFTDTKAGAMFYEAVGFMPSSSPSASHVIEF